VNNKLRIFTCRLKFFKPQDKSQNKGAAAKCCGTFAWNNR